MTLSINGPISMSDIAVEKKGSGLPAGGYWQNISLRGCSVDSVNDFTYYNGDSLITADYPGTPNDSTPYAISEFYGYSHTQVTTNISSIDASSYAIDSSTSATADLRVQYTNSNADIRVYVTGGEDISPSDGSTVFRIVNAPLGYTVRHGTLSFTGDLDSTNVDGTIGTSAVVIPALGPTFYQDFETRAESGGGYDDGGNMFGGISGSLIFEGTGLTTFTYNFDISLDAENAGEGGL